MFIDHLVDEISEFMAVNEQVDSLLLNNVS